MPICVICQGVYEGGRELTCSENCHEKFIERLIAQFGEYKKVVRLSTGIAYKVPTRVIIEGGIREGDLDQYPVWEEDRWDVEAWAAKSRKGEVCGIFGCQNKPTVKCKHCFNMYCEEHRWVLETPAHPQGER